MTEEPTAVQEAAATEEPAATEAPAEATTVSFTDSAGRTVEVPANITKVAVSGPLAQIVLFALCPDKLVVSRPPGTRPRNSTLRPSIITCPSLGSFTAARVN